MNQITHCDWLPEQARWSHLARSRLAAVSYKQNFTKSHIINPLLTKFVRSRWLDIGLVPFFASLDAGSLVTTVHLMREFKLQKKQNKYGGTKIITYQVFFFFLSVRDWIKTKVVLWASVVKQFSMR